MSREFNPERGLLCVGGFKDGQILPSKYSTLEVITTPRGCVDRMNTETYRAHFFEIELGGVSLSGWVWRSQYIGYDEMIRRVVSRIAHDLNAPPLREWDHRPDHCHQSSPAMKAMARQ